MKLKFIFLLFMIPFWGCSNNQDANADRLQSFLNVVSESNVPAEKIISDYICILPPQTADSTRQQIYTLIADRINEMRKQIQTEKNKDFIITKYKDLPSSEQTLILTEDITDDVYNVKFNNKYFISVLFKENRIASFHTLNKGGKRVFLLFCP